MARAAIVPLYIVATSEGNSARGLPVWRITAASPGTTDNLTTTLQAASLTAPARGYLVGGQLQNNTTYNGNGSFRQVGFAMTPAQALASGITSNSTDGTSFDAGNWVIPIHRIRPGGILTGDVPVTFNLNIYRVASVGAGAALQHIGVTSGSFTVTTTETSSNATVAGAAVTFAATDLLWFEIYAESPAAGTSDVVQFPGNSTTGLRISAMPTYVRNYNKSHAESAPAVDSHTRTSAYRRSHGESIPLSEAHAATATFRRYQAETIATPTDVQTRTLIANRQHAESIPLSELHTRLLAYRRPHAESIPLTELHTRTLTYRRAQAENIGPSGGGGASNNYPDGLLRLNGKRIESLSTGQGALPAGALRLVSMP